MIYRNPKLEIFYDESEVLEVSLIFNTILAQVTAIIDNPFALFGLFFIFGAANLIFPPIPLETATLFAGCLSANGHGSVIIIITATVGGMFSGSLILYLITKKYGMNLIEKTPLKKVISAKSYQKAFQWFQKYGLYMMYLGKLIPGMSLYTVICCGILQLKATKALLAMFLSNLLFFTALVLAGRVLGQNWSNALPWLTQIEFISLLFIGILVIYAVMKYFFHHKRSDT
jgi:membrane protein DedA with SNARE-associated domain